MKLASNRYPYSFNRENAIKKLKNIPYENITDVEIIDYRGKYWEFVIEDIQEKAEEEKL